jgi:hypothetical protein
MRSLLLFALLACLSSAAAAVEAGLPSANGSGECPSQQVAAGTLSGGAADADVTPAGETSPRDDAEENTTTGTRPRGAVRWHSLLPGMVR